LVEYDADPTIKCKLGKVPLDHAYTAELRAVLSEAMSKYVPKASTASAKKSSGGGAASSYALPPMASSMVAAIGTGAVSGIARSKAGKDALAKSPGE